MPPKPEHCLRLTLVGTVHRDEQGRSKLRRLLEKLQPDQITLEMSEAALSYRFSEGILLLQRLERIVERLAERLKRPQSELSRHRAIADIRTLLDLPFEYQAAAAYAKNMLVPLELIDRSDISLRKLGRVEKSLITYRNIQVLLKLPQQSLDADQEGYERAALLIERPLDPAVRRAFLERYRGEEGIGRRDLHMADKIRRTLESSPRGHLVHIGGWVHLLEDEQRQTLYSRLEDLRPQRVLLK